MDLTGLGRIPCFSALEMSGREPPLVTQSAKGGSKVIRDTWKIVCSIFVSPSEFSFIKVLRLFVGVSWLVAWQETETHFIRQLEKQGIENRKLRTTIADFVSQIEILKKFRDHLQNKDRAVGFEYQYLLKYHKATQSLLLQILPVASESTNSRIPKPPLALSSARSERWLKLWNWDDFKTQREICGSTRDFGLSGQEEGSAAVTGKHERKTSNEIRRAPIALVSSKRTFFPQSWKGILTQKNLEHRLNRGETPSKTCVK